MTVLMRQTLESNRTELAARCKAVSKAATSQKICHLKMEIVNSQVLDIPVAGRVTSWRPLRVVVTVAHNELVFWERLVDSHIARKDETGLRWSADRFITHNDSLAKVALKEIIDQQQQRAACLDSAMLTAGLGGLIVSLASPAFGAALLMIALLVGQAGWLVAYRLSRQIQVLIEWLDSSKVSRTALITEQPPWRRKGVAGHDTSRT
ncbi:hypothetical protein [Trichlorobacter lovleyi]|uniref:Uncharacterized protein n=1 Tax=Trichlorobacter lovleyi (strain ATCC BAA-1151 / DSM 17278 / SZ) TaxID=398767 RepID=B3E4V2_TRIL1|nr:hypothetical protein [Trichlorobacter lovleyi]ACD96038.1 hypothetical protein Glov_2322 [Trichlorobacter lovleyi SZ]